MPNPISHFAIHADDCERAKTFYERVFGWSFEEWGPPGFWRVHTGQVGVEGALHARHEPLSGRGLRGFECTIAVEDVAKTARMIVAAGGTITMPPFLINGVGTVVKFADTEGNAVGAMQYLPGVLESAGGGA
ncbi:MAG: VOC family protein [Phycisphaeraceae bacterium]|nr:VOC family protein [Phycisphaeraceae bacterium]